MFFSLIIGGEHPDAFGRALFLPVPSCKRDLRVASVDKYDPRQSWE